MIIVAGSLPSDPLLDRSIVYNEEAHKMTAALDRASKGDGILMNAMTQKTTLQIDDYLDLLNLAVHIGDRKWQKEIIRKLEYLKQCATAARIR